MPDPSVAASYAASVPASFRFTVKAPNSLTWANLSARKGKEPEPNPRFLSPELFAEFLKGIAPLGDRTGAAGSDELAKGERVARDQRDRSGCRRKSGAGARGRGR